MSSFVGVCISNTEVQDPQNFLLCCYRVITQNSYTDPQVSQGEASGEYVV